MRRLRDLSLRARLLLVSLAVLAAGLIAGGVLLAGGLHFTLQRAADSESEKTAEGVRRLIDQNSLSDTILAGPSEQVQVVDRDHTVRASSPTADKMTPMLRRGELDGLGDGQITTIPGDRIRLGGRVRVVKAVAGPPTDPLYVLVARDSGQLTQSLDALRITLLVAIPLLLALLAVVLWLLLGAALGPVDALRAGAEEITGGARAGRLPVPQGRGEIHRLAVTLNDMLYRLDAARARQRAFVADAAHELRSPLTNMRTELEVAQHLPGATDWPALTEDLLTDVHRLSRLVDDLLLLARADDAGGRAIPARRERVDLDEFLSALAARYPDVRYRPARPGLAVVAEPDELARVVTNLLDNAARHCRERVELAVAAAGADCLITVTDDGPGIPSADRERVFDRFTRLDEGRARDAGGSGLGLAIVRELVRRHGGTVTLGDAHPGLRAEVRLPAGEITEVAGNFSAPGND